MPDKGNRRQLRDFFVLQRTQSSAPKYLLPKSKPGFDMGVETALSF